MIDVVSWNHSELGELLSSAKPDQLGLVGVQLLSVDSHPRLRCVTYGDSK